MMKAKPKQRTKPRIPKSMDERYMGVEPDPLEFKIASSVDLLHAYNWYNYFHTSEDAKKWTVSANSNPAIKSIPDYELRTIGWTYRLVKQGYELPEVLENAQSKLSILIDKYRKQKKEVTKSVDAEKATVQDRIKIKADNLIGELENLVDQFFMGKLEKDFDVYQWMLGKEVNHFHAKIIKDYYGKWEITKTDWLIKAILAACDSISGNAKIVRRKRKTKPKSASQLLKTFQFKEADVELQLQSIGAHEILGAKEIWLYNCEKRLLTVLRGEITVKGTTILGWDEKTSATKKLRKPAETLKELNGVAKTHMKKVFDSLKVKPQSFSGRTNRDTILLRAFK